MTEANGHAPFTPIGLNSRTTPMSRAMTEDERVETGARAICKVHGHDPDGSCFLSDRTWEWYAPDARAVIAAIAPAIRAAALEEAAKFVDDTQRSVGLRGKSYLAAAIRALKEVEE